MIIADPYSEFVQATAYELRGEGARVLFTRDAGSESPSWLAGWDAVLVNETPGAASLTAFTRGDALDAAALQNRVDRLAGGLAEVGALRGAPVTLNLVVAFADPPGKSASKVAMRLVPRAFFPGLRPRAYAVDLAGEVVSGGRGTPLRGVLESGLNERGRPQNDVAEMERRQRLHVARTGEFYELIRGRQPLVTYGLVVVNVSIFLAMLWSGGAGAATTVLHGGPVPDATVRAWGAQSPILIEHGQWWRLVSEMFLHAGVTHIVFNMASLLAIGTLAERLYGSARYLAIYFGAGLIGSLASFWFAVAQGNLNVLGVGASGAIFGVAGALLTLRFQETDVVPLALRRRISTSMAPLVFISLFLAAVTPYVDNSAHLGGLCGGMALSLAFPLSKNVRVS